MGSGRHSACRCVRSGQPGDPSAAPAYDRAARARYGRIPRPTPAGNSLRRTARLLSAAAYVGRDRTLAQVALIARLAALARHLRRPGRVLTDTGQVLYQRLGAGRAPLWRVHSPATLAAYVAAAAHGHRPAKPVEDTRQLGADAIMVNGVVRQLWRPRTPSDRPPAAQVIARLVVSSDSLTLPKLVSLVKRLTLVGCCHAIDEPCRLELLHRQDP